MKRKIALGVILILLGISVMLLGVFILDHTPKLESFTLKEAGMLFGIFMLFFVGATGIVGGCTLIEFTLDE